MIENDDQGVESQFIDPFAPSMEAYPFPVEDYIPPTPEKTIPDPDQVVVPALGAKDIPQLNEDGTLENGNALKVTEEQGVVVDPSDFTDTPVDPLDKPDGDEVRISFEEGEDKEANDTLDVLDEITKIHEQLKTIGGVSKDDVIAFESYCPGVITSKTPLNRFSSIPTPMGLEVSLESIVDQIVQMVRTFVEWLIRQAKKVVDWILSRLERAQTNNLFDVKAKWSAVENIAKRIDSTGNSKAYKTRYARYPHAAKSATTLHFITLHANAVMKRVFTNFNVGMLNVQKGSAFGEAKSLTLRMSQMRDYVTGGVNNFKTGRPVNDINKGIAGDAFDIMEHSEHIAKLKAEFRELASPMIKEYKNAITVKDIRAAVANDLKTIGDALIKLQREITTLDETVLGSKDKGKFDTDGLRKVKDGMRILVSQSVELDVYLDFFTKYCSASMMVAEECERVALSLRLP